MIHKRILMLLGLMALVVSSCLSAESVVPAFEQLNKVTFLTGNGWSLEIMPDGSGKLVYGSSATDVASISAGSFSLRQIYDEVTPKLLSSAPKGALASVTFRAAGQVSVRASYLADETVIADYLRRAKLIGTPFDPERFEQLWRDRPPKTRPH